MLKMLVAFLGVFIDIYQVCENIREKVSSLFIMLLHYTDKHQIQDNLYFESLKTSQHNHVQYMHAMMHCSNMCFNYYLPVLTSE